MTEPAEAPTTSLDGNERCQLQPQEPPQQPPPPPLGADLGALAVPELGPACTATRLISGMLATLSHEGQTAASSRLAIGLSSSKIEWQSLQRYS